MRAAAVVALLAVVVTACGTPPPEPAAVPDVEHAWTYHGQVEHVLPDRAAAAVLEDDQALDTAWRDLGFATDRPQVDFDEQVVLLVGQADDGCPDEPVRLEVVDGGLELAWLTGPGACPQPLVLRLHAFRVHRAVLGDGFTYALPAPHTDQLAPTTVPLDPHPGPAPPAPPAPAPVDEEALAAVFDGHPVARCGPAHDVVGPLEPPGSESAEAAASERLEAAIEALLAAGVDVDRELVPLVERRDGEPTPVFLAAADDADAVRARLRRSFGDDAPAVRVTRWAPAVIRDAQTALEPLLGPHEEPGAIVSLGGPPGPVEVGMIDPTRAQLDAIAELVDPSLVCVQPLLRGVRPADGGEAGIGHVQG